MSRDGTIRAEGDLRVIRFERELPHAVDDVWQMLTDTEKWKQWLTSEGTLDLRVGGKVVMNEHEIDSTVIALEPPRVFEFGWDGPHWKGGTVRFELEPTDNGTRVVLTHRTPTMTPDEAAEFKARYPGDLPEDWEPMPSTLAGWHVILNALEQALESGDGSAAFNEWATLNQHYKPVVSAVSDR